MKMNKVYVIAEIGVNHNGNISLAKKMIDSASKAGADAVKFQAYKTKYLSSEDAPLSSYQTSKTIKKNQFDLLNEYELSSKNIIELIDYSKKYDLDLLFSVFDNETIKELVVLGINRWKIPSGELTNYFLLSELAKYDHEVIISTGMGLLADIESAISVLTSVHPNRKISILHCVSQYPTPLNEVNLRTIPYLKNKFAYDIGFSDHTDFLETSLIAVTMGASIIERHFTLDKSMVGPDHSSSLNLEELTTLIDKIRIVESMLGEYGVFMMNCEIENSIKVRKSIVAKTSILSGDTLSEINLTALRPAIGLSPMAAKKIIGKTSKSNYNKGELILECEIDN
jgi:N,N'-diacetyllegionaminate synthase